MTMRFRQLFEVNPRYQQMFAKAIAHKGRPWAKQIMDNELAWARVNLGQRSDRPGRTDIRRNDRIVWYMRIIRDRVIGKIGQIDDVGNKPTNIQTTINYLHQKLTHYLSMPINAIQEFRFERQPYEEVFKYFDRLEKEWAEKQSRLVQDNSSEWTPLVKFPDGAVWFNLNTYYCDEEAAAMGHCGNKAAGYAGQNVLSLRFPKKTPDGLMWEPALTFILGKNGVLGERKGRGNTRPADHYHKYIVELLKLPIIKGINTNTGYAPKEDFQMDQLPPHLRAEVEEKNPNTMPLEVQFRKHGITPEIINRVLSEFEEADVSYDKGYPRWDQENRSILVGEYSDVETLVKENGDRIMEWAHDVLSGKEYFEDNYNISSEEAYDLFTDLPKEVQNNIGEYAVSEYNDWYVEEYGEDLNPRDRQSVWDVLSENDDEIVENIKHAMADGLRTGAEGEMADAFYSAIKDHHDDDTGFYLIYDNFDAPIYVAIGMADAIHYLSKGVPDGQWIHQITMDEPSYGWSGYNKEVAIESALSNLPRDMASTTVAPNPEQPSPSMI